MKVRFCKWLIRKLVNIVNKDVDRVFIKELSDYEIEHQIRKQYYDKFKTIKSAAQIKVDKELMGESWGKPLKEI